MAAKLTISTLNGVLNINKPTGMTSHDVVAQVRRLLRGVRLRLPVGHGGTLDPFATGVLLILVGSATRLMDYVHELPKRYEATATLGATSDTDDCTGHITQGSATIPTPAEIETILHRFVGPQQQVPPAYAALKVAGQKLYDYARRGEKVVRRARPIEIYSVELKKYQYPSLNFTVTCGRGTYIRALVRDIGKTLKTGAYTAALHRAAIGPFHDEKSIKIADLTPESLSRHLQPAETLIAHLPALILNAGNVAKLKQGRSIVVEINKIETNSARSDRALFDESRQLCGIGNLDPNTLTLSPTKILNQ